MRNKAQQNEIQMSENLFGRRIGRIEEWNIINQGTENNGPTGIWLTYNDRMK